MQECPKPEHVPRITGMLLDKEIFETIDEVLEIIEDSADRRERMMEALELIETNQ